MALLKWPEPGRNGATPPADSAEGRMPLMDHLRELRNRLLIAPIAVVVGIIVGWIFFDPIWRFSRRPTAAPQAQQLRPGQCTSDLSGIFQSFFVTLKVSAMFGLVVSSPVWLYQIWAFVTPGLYRNEKRYSVCSSSWRPAVPRGRGAGLLHRWTPAWRSCWASPRRTRSATTDRRIPQLRADHARHLRHLLRAAAAAGVPQRHRGRCRTDGGQAPPHGHLHHVRLRRRHHAGRRPVHDDRAGPPMVVLFSLAEVFMYLRERRLPTGEDFSHLDDDEASPLGRRHSDRRTDRGDNVPGVAPSRRRGRRSLSRQPRRPRRPDACACSTRCRTACGAGGAEVSVIVGTTPPTPWNAPAPPWPSAPPRWWPSAATAWSTWPCRPSPGPDVPLGIIPAGTGNDIAGALGVPAQGSARAPPRPCSRGGSARSTPAAARRPGEWFAGVLALRVRLPGQRAGQPADLAARDGEVPGRAGQELRSFRPDPVPAHLDGGSRSSARPCWSRSATPAPTAPGCGSAPARRPDDGLLDVIDRRGACPSGEFLRVFPRVYRGSHVTHPAVHGQAGPAGSRWRRPAWSPTPTASGSVPSR